MSKYHELTKDELVHLCCACDYELMKDFKEVRAYQNLRPGSRAIKCLKCNEIARKLGLK